MFLLKSGRIFRSVAALLLALLLLPLPVLPASAEPVAPEDDFLYMLYDDHAAILAYLGTSQTVVVPSFIQGKPVTEIQLGKSDNADDSDAFLYVRKIVLPDTVKKLGDYCFGGYSILGEVTGLEYVEEAGYRIFNESGLEKAVFSAKLRKVDGNAFSGNHMSLADLTIPDDLDFKTGIDYGLYFSSALQTLRLIRGSGAPKYLISEDVLFTADKSKLICVLPYKAAPFYEIPSGTESVSISSIYCNDNVLEYQFPASLSITVDDLPFRHSLILDVFPGTSAYNFFMNLKETVLPDLAIHVLGQGGEKSLSEITSGILSAVLDDSMSDYQKARALHDWICEHTAYDNSLNNYDARDVLLDGSGVCEAYARAYAALLTSAGIPNRTVTCSLSYTNHMINAVQLGGKWYLVDCTNDDEGFGAPDSLFCFNVDVFRQFYRGGLPVDADDLSLYAPYVRGDLTAPQAFLEQRIRENIEAGLQSFTVEGAELQNVGQIPGSALCSLVNAKKWTVNGTDYTVICTTQDGSVYSCSVVFDTDFVYEEDEAGVWLIRYRGSDARVEVPAQIGGKPVVGLRETFMENTVVREVVLPQGLKEIGENAFYGCSSLETVNFPSSVTRIGSCAFAGCISLSGSVVLPSRLKAMENGAFSGCVALQRVKIPGTIEEYGLEWFADCVQLRTVVLSEGLTEVPMAAFLNCSALKSVTLPQSLTDICSAAFTGSGLVSLDIPANVSSVNWGAFLNAKSLETVTVSPDNPTYTARDNILFSKDMTCLIRVLGKIPSSYTIPDGVQEIENFSFALDQRILHLRIPSSVRYLGTAAFSNSTVEDVYIEDGLTTIGDYAFAPVYVGTEHFGMSGTGSSLFSIRLPETLTSLGTGAFFGNAYLKYLVLPASLKTVDVPFINYPQRLYIPEGITRIAPQQTQPWISEDEVHGKKGTYAEQYAAEHGFRFVDESGSIGVFPDTLYLLPQEEYTLEILSVDGSGSKIPASQITWESSDPCVAVNNGVLRAGASGSAVITASGGGLIGTCQVHIYAPYDTDSYDLSIIGGKELLKVGEGLQAVMYLTILTDDADDPSDTVEINDHVRWSVSDPQVMTITENAFFTAVGPGACDVVVTLPDGQEFRTSFTVLGRKAGQDVPDDGEFDEPDEPEEPEEPEKILRGDVNKDKVVDGRDVIRLMKYLAGEIDPETKEVWEIDEKAADLTGDEEVNELDLLHLVKFLGGSIPSLD